MRKLLLGLVALLLTTTAQAQINQGEIVINEFSADSDSLSGIADPDGGYPDWIELYNTTDAAIDLSGIFLSDKEDELQKWQFPAETLIAEDGYLIVWADEDLDQTGLHADFKLSRGGEGIYLSNADGSIVDGFEYGEQMTNVSSSRVPNGTGSFVMQHATPLFSNDTPVSSRQPVESITLSAYPNPATDFIQLMLPEATTGELTLSLYGGNGRVIYQDQPITATNRRVELSGLSSGIYIAKVRGAAGRAGVIRFTKL